MISGPRVSAVSPVSSVESPGRNTPDPDDANELALIPVRMLNEFTYCPRLGYLEWVQGEWADNLETRQGTFGHRNVDQPDRQQFGSPESNVQSPEPADGASDPGSSAPKDDSIHARSISLSAPLEGLVAKLDVLEIEGTRATPVDYKRGKVPDVPGGAYDPERVQLCAQGLILRENGFECTEGVLYFMGSRQRVTIPFDDELISHTREQARRLRATAARGVCPPPLVDSPKCPRCSLVTICLPDETNFLRHFGGDADKPADGGITDIAPDGDQLTLRIAPPTGEPPKPDDGVAGSAPPLKDGLRRLLPARNDALPLYVQEFGAYLGKSGDRLTVSKERKELASVRLLDISQVCLFGNVTVSAPALKELTTRGIPICHFTYGGWFHGMTTGLVHNNVELRIRQYAAASDPAESLALAKAMVAGKIKNCRTLLRRHLGDREAPVLRQLAEYCRRVRRVDSIDSLLGLEGMAAKEYFSSYFILIAGQSEFDVHSRNRRPPRDPINAVLSFVYSLLTKELTIALQSVGFDPMLGFYHRPRFSRPSLALDLAEEFRPLIADSVTLTVFNNGEVDGGSFLERAGAATLTSAGRRAVLAAYERRLATEITHPIFGYKVSYRRVLEVQARLLARTMLGEIAAYPNFCTR
ncbi:MAG: CRISPR-associated endonuclease Cas1 [Planctomyces sp.]|nr:CRISPR-associated endonuclease Cas1 [Planctomyces sp.]